jgi:hypothetical protein
VSGLTVTWYRGYYRAGLGGIIEALAADGTTIGMVAHLPKHSPTGISWGYLGSGPSDCARSLLIAVLGKAAVCPICNGQAPLDCVCDLGYRFLPYHQFKEDVVAHLQDDWTLARADVTWWLLHHVPGSHDWLTPDAAPALYREEE